ncbi:ribosome biogenesis GTPase Der [bacterium]|nr:ribosome biogenesis GTPase Der [bacterium]MBU1153841.1 ribosome biogenesis GTPase Der [bacterium]
MKKPIVTVVGKPNVGKSTLVNRLVGKSVAIVDNLPGVTRDRKYFEVNWQGKEFTLIDTGGLDLLSKERMLSLIRRQVEVAIAEANLIIFVIDGRNSLDETDKNIAEKIRKSKKPYLLVVNKIDSNYANLHQHEHFLQVYQLALNEPIPISSLHGLNIDQLLDKVIKNIPSQKEDPKKELINIAIVGRPNVGKSSLLNKILGEERVIVDQEPGTTRDSIEVCVERNKEYFNFIDTAGIRKKRNIILTVEKYSSAKAIESIKKADVVLLIIDITAGLADQDKKILTLMEKYGCGGIILVNKCDLVDLDEPKMIAYQDYLRRNISFGDYLPIAFISAFTGKGLLEIFDLTKKVFNEYDRWISTGNLNRIVSKVFFKYQPPIKKGKSLKIYYTTQLKSKPPSFLFFVNHPEMVTDSYRKYLVSQIRKELGSLGTPIKILVRKSGV